MDYVDLYQIHRWDYETPLRKAWQPCTMCQGRQGTLHRRIVHVSPGNSAQAQNTATNEWAVSRLRSMQNHPNQSIAEEERE